MMGEGTFHYKNGNIYTGNFGYGRWEGKGVMRFANGAIYDGDWRFNKFHG